MLNSYLYLLNYASPVFSILSGGSYDLGHSNNCLGSPREPCCHLEQEQ